MDISNFRSGRTYVDTIHIPVSLPLEEVGQEKTVDGRLPPHDRTLA
jgi:hypothetical protein